MNNFAKKTTGKLTLWAIVVGVLLIAGIVLCAILGLNGNATSSDVKTFTVRTESFYSDLRAKKIENICENAFESAGITYKYEKTVKYSSGNLVNEKIYAFSVKTDDNKLAQAKTAVENGIVAASGETDGVLFGLEEFIGVSVNSLESVSVLAKDFLLRGIIAGALVAVLAFIYTVFRHGLWGAVLTACSGLVAGALTFAVVALSRIPVGTSFAVVVGVGEILATVFALLFFNKVKESKKNGNTDGDTVVADSVPVKEMLILSAFVALGLIATLALCVMPFKWFAVEGLIAVAVSLYVGVLLLPSVYMPVFNAEKANADKKARYDYKKD